MKHPGGNPLLLFSVGDVFGKPSAKAAATHSAGVSTGTCPGPQRPAAICTKSTTVSVWAGCVDSSMVGATVVVSAVVGAGIGEGVGSEVVGVGVGLGVGSRVVGAGVGSAVTSSAVAVGAVSVANTVVPPAAVLELSKTAVGAVVVVAGRSAELTGDDDAWDERVRVS